MSEEKTTEFSGLLFLHADWLFSGILKLFFPLSRKHTGNLADFQYNKKNIKKQLEELLTKYLHNKDYKIERNFL